MDPLEAALQQSFSQQPKGSASPQPQNFGSIDDAIYASFANDTPKQEESTGFLGTVGRVANDVGKYALQSATDMAVGVGSRLGQTAFGTAATIPELNGWIAGKLGATSYRDTAYDVGKKIREVGDAIYVDPFVQKKNELAGTGGWTDYHPNIESGAGRIGQYGTDIGLLMSPAVSKKVTAGQKVLATAADKVDDVARNVPLVGKAFGYGSRVAAHASPEAALGFTQAKIHGESNGKALTEAALFGAGSAAFKMLGDGYKAWRGGINYNVQKALGVKAKGSVGATLQQTDDAIGAFDTIHQLAPELKIKDTATMSEKIFDPKTASISDLAQALKQSKDRIYDMYTQMATKAGDSGATFTSSDFNSLLGQLKTLGTDATADMQTEVGKQMATLVKNYAMKGADGAPLLLNNGNIRFQNVPLKNMQTFLESINRTVNPLSNRSGAEVGGELSKGIRNILDDKITSSSNEGYQVLRTKYAQLKSIEKQVETQFAKAASKRGGDVADYVNGFGTLDIINGLITSNPSKALHGVGETFLGSVMKHLRNTDTYIGRVFDALEKAKTPPSDSSLVPRAFGKTASEVLPKTVKKIPTNLDPVIPQLPAPGQSVFKLKEQSPIIVAPKDKVISFPTKKNEQVIGGETSSLFKAKGKPSAAQIRQTQELPEAYLKDSEMPVINFGEKGKLQGSYIDAEKLTVPDMRRMVEDLQKQGVIPEKYIPDDELPVILFGNDTKKKKSKLPKINY